MTRCNLVLLLAFLLLGVSKAATTAGHAFVQRQRRVAARHPHKYKGSGKDKVRGKTKEQTAARRILKGDGFSDDSMGAEGSMMSSKSSKKGSKSQMGSSKSKSGKGGSSKSKSGNIFEHPEEEQAIEKQEVQVQCGSDESPFLTTFVTSIRLHQPTKASKSLKQKSSKKSSPKSRVDQEDEGSEMASITRMDDLTGSEQRILEETFRKVYNNWTFENCDGFFRTVYTVSLTMVERDEEGDDYAVTLESTYRDGEEGVEMRIVNGTMDNTDNIMMMDNDFDIADEGEEDMGDTRWLQVFPNMTDNITATPPKGFGTRDANSGDEGPMSYVQTVSGGDDLPIYYVSLAATCRNCAVTDEVNFPLLMLPEDDKRGRVLQETTTATTTSAEAEGEAVCTCLLPVEDNEVEISRRRRRLDGHELYVPQPMGPTPEEFIQAMNDAIQGLQENEGKLTRIEGLVDLIEPDYFDGENPDRERGPTNAPTISPMPSVSAAPSQAPTASAAPSTSKMPSTPSLMVQINSIYILKLVVYCLKRSSKMLLSYW